MVSSSRRMSLLSGALCSSSICSTPWRTRSISAWSSARARSAEADIASSPEGRPGSSGGVVVTGWIVGAAGAGKGAPLRETAKEHPQDAFLRFRELGLQQVEAVAADRQLVAGVELGDVDLAAVDEDAVEAAVVEEPRLLALLDCDHCVAAGDAGVVEADLGGGT